MVESNIKGHSLFKLKCTPKPLWKPKKAVKLKLQIIQYIICFTFNLVF